VADDGCVVVATGVPHSLQKSALGTIGVPQDVQASERRVPQRRQNLPPGSFTAPQFEQITPSFPLWSMLRVGA